MLRSIAKPVVSRASKRVLDSGVGAHQTNNEKSKEQRRTDESIVESNRESGGKWEALGTATVSPYIPLNRTKVSWRLPVWSGMLEVSHTEYVIN